MRIIGGQFKGQRLQGPRSSKTRPTQDQDREMLFNILQHRYAYPRSEMRVLDLYAGTGALGLEALSRGAGLICFVDHTQEACEVIRSNCALLKVQDRTHVLRREVQRLKPGLFTEAFDLVFLDPPYHQNLVVSTLKLLQEGSFLNPEALCCVEMERGPLPLLPSSYTCLDIRARGPRQMVFLSKKI